MEFDIYGDLENFNAELLLKEKCDEVNVLKKKYESSIETIKDLQNENKEWKRKLRNIERSFWSLLETAKIEVSRKDRRINELTQEIDNIKFRRYSHKNQTSYDQNETTRNGRFEKSLINYKREEVHRHANEHICQKDVNFNKIYNQEKSERDNSKKNSSKLRTNSGTIIDSVPKISDKLKTNKENDTTLKNEILQDVKRLKKKNLVENSNNTELIKVNTNVEDLIFDEMLNESSALNIRKENLKVYQGIESSNDAATFSEKKVLKNKNNQKENMTPQEIPESENKSSKDQFTKNDPFMEAKVEQLNPARKNNESEESRKTFNEKSEIFEKSIIKINEDKNLEETISVLDQNLNNKSQINDCKDTMPIIKRTEVIETSPEIHIRQEVNQLTNDDEVNESLKCDSFKYDQLNDVTFEEQKIKSIEIKNKEMHLKEHVDLKKPNIQKVIFDNKNNLEHHDNVNLETSIIKCYEEESETIEDIRRDVCSISFEKHNIAEDNTQKCSGSKKETMINTSNDLLNIFNSSDNLDFEKKLLESKDVYEENVTENVIMDLNKRSKIEFESSLEQQEYQLISPKKFEPKAFIPIVENENTKISEKTKRCIDNTEMELNCSKVPLYENELTNSDTTERTKKINILENIQIAPPKDVQNKSKKDELKTNNKESNNVETKITESEAVSIVKDIKPKILKPDVNKILPLLDNTIEMNKSATDELIRILGNVPKFAQIPKKYNLNCSKKKEKNTNATNEISTPKKIVESKSSSPNCSETLEATKFLTDNILTNSSDESPLKDKFIELFGENMNEENITKKEGKTEIRNSKNEIGNENIRKEEKEMVKKNITDLSEANQNLGIPCKSMSLKNPNVMGVNHLRKNCAKDNSNILKIELKDGDACESNNANKSDNIQKQIDEIFGKSPFNDYTQGQFSLYDNLGETKENINDIFEKSSEHNKSDDASKKLSTSLKNYEMQIDDNGTQVWNIIKRHKKKRRIIELQDLEISNISKTKRHKSDRDALENKDNMNFETHLSVQEDLEDEREFKTEKINLITKETYIANNKQNAKGLNFETKRFPEINCELDNSSLNNNQTLPQKTLNFKTDAGDIFYHMTNDNEQTNVKEETNNESYIDNSKNDSENSECKNNSSTFQHNTSSVTRNFNTSTKAYEMKCNENDGIINWVIKRKKKKHISTVS